MANVAAGASFVVGYLGLLKPRTPQAGPAPEWLAQKVNDAAWEERRHLATVVTNHATFFENDRAIFRQARTATLVGLTSLLVAVAAYAGAGFHVL